MSILRVRSEKRTWCIDLLLLTFFLILLFGLFLGSRPLSTPDEARYSEIPREMLVTHDFVTPHLNGIKYFEKPPLFYWLQAMSLHFFYPQLSKQSNSLDGPSSVTSQRKLATKMLSEWVVRIPNALIALFGCLFLYISGRQLFDRQTGMISAMILATSFLYFGLARLVTLDMTLCVFFSNSLLSFLMAIKNPSQNESRIFLYLFYIFAALAVLTKGLIGIVFPGLIIGTWIVLTKQWHLLRKILFPSGILLFLVISLPWHIFVQLKNPEFFRFYFIDQQFLRYSTLIAQRYQPDWFFIPVFFLGFLPWIVFLFEAIVTYVPKIRQQFTDHYPMIFLLLWMAIVFIFFSFSHSKLITYILPIFPAASLVTGHYLSHAPFASGIKRGVIVLPFLWLIIGLSVTVWFQQHLAGLSKVAITYLLKGYAFVILASIISALFYIKRYIKIALTLLIIGTGVGYIIFATAIPYIDTRSIKPLVQQIKSVLRKQDKVVAFENYYQDLPFYLNQCVATVNVSGELSFGMLHQNTQAWMLNEAEFWSLWRKHQYTYMLVNKKLYSVFKKQKKIIYLIASTPHDVLLSNNLLQSRLTHEDN